MELLHLKYFAKIAEYENMTRAAGELHIAQSALSRVLSGLEKEFGVKLFQRDGRHLRLNENGRILLHCSRDVFQRLDDMHKELSDANDMNHGQTITIVVRVASKFLPAIISGFSQQHENVRIVIIQNADYGNGEKRHWDLLLDAARQKEEDDDTVCVLREEIRLALPKNHPLASRPSIALHEVAEESFLGMQKGSSMNEIATYYCQQAGFTPNVILESDNPATMRGLMRLGLGIAFNPIVTWKEVSEGEICLVPISGVDCCRYIHLKLHPGVYHSRAVMAFRAYLIDFFAHLPKLD